MKNWLFILSAIIALKSCVKDPAQPVVRGKLVHRSCASIVVQVLDSNYYYLGQPAWQSPTPAKTPYEHVFAVANTCSFPGGVTEGQEFSFKVLSRDPSMKDCVICMLWDNPPQKKQIIKVVQP